jgi:excisionase family DNA binding protein
LATTTTSASDREQWVSRPEACRRLRCGPRALNRLIEAGRLSVLHVPGSIARVRLDEVEQLHAQALRPATHAIPSGGAA